MMDALYNAIDGTPIIDNHAHNLLLPHELLARDFMAITSEADGEALKATPSSLSHIRAVKQLSDILGCEADWEEVQAAIAKRRKIPGDEWAKECFDGIETVLIDDGLDASTVHSWDWHDRLTRSPCKRIVRIEKVAESIMDKLLKKRTTTSHQKHDEDIHQNIQHLLNIWTTEFQEAIRHACQDVNVVGFKSVICYRTGLAVPYSVDQDELMTSMKKLLTTTTPFRLDDQAMSPFILLMAAGIIESSYKPLQFHTGLGDNDITLSLSSPSLLQPFIKKFPKLQIVLLHSSYPFTREAGYLATVYENVYLDIGEVFPMVSQDGQESIIRESLELCPSEKLCWSTDGHWFPETYLLAVIQIREGLKTVLRNSVTKGSLTISQAIKTVEDILFHTSNKLYRLHLQLKPLSTSTISRLRSLGTSSSISLLHLFLAKHPSVKYLRTQWLDYTATPRTRILPIDRAIILFSADKSIGITKAAFGMLQTDFMIPSFSATGEYKLVPCFESLRLGERGGYATVQCEFKENDGQEVNICPRSALRRAVQRGTEAGIEFLIGFELEVVFLRPITSSVTQKTTYQPLSNSGGHSWSANAALRGPDTMTMIEEIVAALQTSEIDLQQWHPESAPGQYEFITGPLPPLAAVDTLIATREIIFAVAAKHGLKATFVPKPYPQACGTGAHFHISLTPEDKYEIFYAGVLSKLRAIAAFTYSGEESYDRVADSVWSGGRYVCWGTQNRETPLRKVEGSHWEIKCMDGLANAYLAIAAVLNSGLRGIERDIKLHLMDCTDDPALLTVAKRKALGIQTMMPESLNEAIVALEELLGDEEEWDDVCNVYQDVKVAERDMLGKMPAEERRVFMIEHY